MDNYNIKLKISNDTLIALSKTIQNIHLSRNSSGLAKVMVSIGIDIADKVVSKARKAQRQTSIFDNKKKHTLSLKFHEVFALVEILNILNIFNETDNHLHYTLINKLQDELNQKLC